MFWPWSQLFLKVNKVGYSWPGHLSAQDSGGDQLRGGGLGAASWSQALRQGLK